MHNRKIIASGLAIGITVSSLSSDAMANTINEYELVREERMSDSTKDNIFESIINNLFVKKPKSRQNIKVNKNIEEGKILNITLNEGDSLQDLTDNPDGYETIIITTTGSKKLSSADLGMLNKSTIPNIDLSNAQAVSIPNNAFNGNKNLTTFKFPRGVASIGVYAFSGCTNLVGDLIIPDTVTSIGSFAFNGCTSLNGTLTLPNELTSISGNSFLNCSGLTGDLYIPQGVTIIGGNAFKGCSGFNGELTLSNSLESIGAYAFQNCSGLIGELVIPDMVTSVGSYAFQNCTGFTEKLIIGNSVKSIGDNAFRGCSKLTGDLIIPDSTTSIGPSAFMSCSGFNGKLKISNSITSIGSNAFNACSGLTGNLILPETLEVLNNGVFNGCSGFNGKLVLPNSIISIDTYAFQGCSKLTGDLIIPDSVVTIGGNSFNSCSGFTGNLIIGDSVTTIGGNAFNGCTGFRGNLVIGNSVETIGSSAFHNCRGFTGELIIPNSVTSIGTGAFNTLSSVTKLILSNSLTSIGANAFYNCKNIDGDVYIPNSLTSISGNIFNYCDNIDRIIIKVSEEDEETEYKKDIITSLLKSKVKLEIPYTFNFNETWIGEQNFNVIQPIIKSIVDDTESEIINEINEIISLNIPMDFMANESSILKDEESYSFPKVDSNGNYIFTEDGDYQVTIKTKLETMYNLEFKVRTKQMQEAEELVTEIIDTTPTVASLDEVRSMVNALPESFRKEELQRALNSISVDLELEKKNATANLDVYIKSENMLSLSLDTNSVTFDNYSGAEDVTKPNAVNLTVSSSLPYKVNAYLESNIENADGSNDMDISLFNIKDGNDSDFKEFTGIKTPVVLLDGQPKGNGVIHSIDLKLKGSLAHRADIYKAVVKFEIEQK